jgi:hypothetical protein
LQGARNLAPRFLTGVEGFPLMIGQRRLSAKADAWSAARGSNNLADPDAAAIASFIFAISRPRRHEDEPVFLGTGQMGRSSCRYLARQA